MSDEHEVPVKVVDRRRWNPDGSTHPGAEPSGRKPTYVEELERQLAEKDRIVQEELAKYPMASVELVHPHDRTWLMPWSRNEIDTSLDSMPTIEIGIAYGVTFRPCSTKKSWY